MFTWIIQRLGEVTQAERDGAPGRIAIKVPECWHDLETGESIAVEGVCLTVVDICDEGTVSFDLLRETLSRTNLGEKEFGASMNLERALAHGQKLGGHIMNGHVDGVGVVDSVSVGAREVAVHISCGGQVLDGIVFKGCIACNGVSLTVASVDPRGFGVHLIPETLTRTSFGSVSVGEAVNLEIDIVSKYVREYISRGLFPGEVNWAALRERGLS